MVKTEIMDVNNFKKIWQNKEQCQNKEQYHIAVTIVYYTGPHTYIYHPYVAIP